MNECKDCKNNPAFNGGYNIFVALDEDWPRDKKERFKLKLEGENVKAEIHFCIKCGLEQAVQNNKVVETWKNEEIIQV